MAVPPYFVGNVDFNPGGFGERDIEKFLTRPWKEFADKADAIARFNEDRIAALEARVAKLEARLKRKGSNGRKTKADPVRRFRRGDPQLHERVERG